MEMDYKRVVVSSIYLVEICAAVYGAFIFWLACVWMTHDFLAVQYTEVDWWLQGAKRFLIYGGVGAVFGLLVYVINTKAIKGVGYRQPSVGKYVAICVGAILVMASLVGSLQFAIEKPFM